MTVRMDNVLVAVDEVTEYGGYRMCYLRGPDGIMVALTEQLA